jgi:hypothetical protein
MAYELAYGVYVFKGSKPDQGCHQINRTSIKSINLNQSDGFFPINQSIVDDDIFDLFDVLSIHRVGGSDP